MKNDQVDPILQNILNAYQEGIQKAEKRKCRCEPCDVCKEEFDLCKHNCPSSDCEICAGERGLLK